MARDHDARRALLDRLSELRGRHDSLDAVRETVDIHRRLAADTSENALSDDEPGAPGPLAAALLLLALRQTDAARHEEAFAAVVESAAIFRDLAERQPNVVRLQDFAVALTKQAYCLHALGRHAAAAETAAECVEIYRRLAGMTAGGFRADLMLALGTLYFLAVDRGDDAGAFAAINESLTLACSLCNEEFRALGPRILQIAENYGGLCHHLGHDLQDDNRYFAVLAELWEMGLYDPHGWNGPRPDAKDADGNDEGQA